MRCWVHPTAVAWAGRQGREFRRAPQRRDIVLPGPCTFAVEARAGDEFVADFTGLGLVRCRPE